MRVANERGTMSRSQGGVIRRLRAAVIDIDAGFAELRRTRTTSLSVGSAFLYRGGRTTDLARRPPRIDGDSVERGFAANQTRARVTNWN